MFVARMQAKTASRRGAIEPHPDDVRAQVLRIVHSRFFADAEQLGVLLEFIVEETLAGRQSRLHLTFAARESQRDLQRVRERLRGFYSHNREEPVLITIPKDGCSALFELKLLDAGPGVGRGKQRAALLFLTMAATATAATVAFLMWPTEPYAPVAKPVRMLLSISGDTAIADLRSAGPPIVSPDGRQIVFVARAQGRSPRLFTRQIESVSALPVRGTEGATYPFWSPDNRHVGFFSDGKLKSVDLTTDLARTLADAPNGRGGTWSHRGTILFAPDVRSPIMRIAAEGGPVSPVTEIGLGESHVRPVFLPDGERFLYLRRMNDESRGRVFGGALDKSIAAGPLLETDSQVLFAAGHLLHVRKSELLAEKFDPADLRIGGEPTVLARGLPADRLADFTVSADGLLMHRTSEQEKGSVAWHDRRGRVLETLSDAGSDTAWALSPDGSMVAIAGADESGRQTLRLRSLNDGSLRETFLQEPASRLIWSTTSDTVYGSGRRSLIRLQLPEAHVVQLMQSEWTPEPSDVAPDGSFLVYHQRGSAGNLDVWRLPLGKGESRPEPLVQTAFDEFDARISPDGRWLAYVSEGNGQPHVNLRALHHSGSADRKISIGLQPRWRSDGHELFYLTPAGMLMAVPVRPPSHGSPSPLFKTGIRVNSVETSSYGVAQDGRRFLAPLAAAETNRQSWTVVKNWAAETQTSGLQ